MLAWILCGILVVTLIALLIKIHLMRKSIVEITTAVSEHLSSDTNTQIFISSNDKYVKHLAEQLASQLKILKKQRQRYTQGDKELKEAVTNISHDLRTPLTAICGYLDLMELEPKSENVKRYISEIAERTEAMKSLTEELFRYSVVSSVSELQIKATDICKVLEDTLISFYAVMKERNIEPVIKIPEQPVIKNVDYSALSRIYSNVINNAVKYSDGDFCVTMTADGETVFANTASKLTTVDVAKLFDRFYTVDPSRKSTGIGLSIAKVLTERMGGRIQATYNNRQLKITVVF